MLVKDQVMVSRFEKLPDELQLLVVDQLQFADVMDMCQTSKTIRGDRCRHLLKHWLKKNVPDAFAHGSWYKDNHSPTEWIRIYTESQLKIVVEALRFTLYKYKDLFSAEAEIYRMVKLWRNKQIPLERLPIRAASQYHREFVPLINRIKKHIVEGRVLSNYSAASILFIVLCGNSKVLYDLVGYSKDSWRLLVLRHRYQRNAKVYDNITESSPLIPADFLKYLLKERPYFPNDISPDLKADEYIFLLSNSLISCVFDDVLKRCSVFRNMQDEESAKKLMQAFADVVERDDLFSMMETYIRRTRGQPGLQGILKETKQRMKARQLLEEDIRKAAGAPHFQWKVSFVQASKKGRQLLREAYVKQLKREPSDFELTNSLVPLLRYVAEYYSPTNDGNPQTDFENQMVTALSSAELVTA